MPKGRKGAPRVFTSPEELAAQTREINEERLRRGAAAAADSESESESDGEVPDKGAKGPQGMIEVQNPNQVSNKAKKITELEVDAKPALSRKEREEVERQAAKLRYDKLHAAGKTDEAQADLARLAIVRAEREAAARKREIDRRQKELEKEKAREQSAIKLDGKTKHEGKSRGGGKKKGAAGGKA